MSELNKWKAHEESLPCCFCPHTGQAERIRFEVEAWDSWKVSSSLGDKLGGFGSGTEDVSGTGGRSAIPGPSESVASGGNDEGSLKGPSKGATTLEARDGTLTSLTIFCIKPGTVFWLETNYSAIDPLVC